MDIFSGLFFVTVFIDVLSFERRDLRVRRHRQLNVSQLLPVMYTWHASTAVPSDIMHFHCGKSVPNRHLLKY